MTQPWKRVSGRQHWIDTGTGFIAINTGSNCENDARLIAAAPELLECLTAALAYLEDDSRSPRRREACISDFRAAISKATGE